MDGTVAVELLVGLVGVMGMLQEVDTEVVAPFPVDAGRALLLAAIPEGLVAADAFAEKIGAATVPRLGEAAVGPAAGTVPLTVGKDGREAEIASARLVDVSERVHLVSVVLSVVLRGAGTVVEPDAPRASEMSDDVERVGVAALSADVSVRLVVKVEIFDVVGGVSEVGFSVLGTEVPLEPLVTVALDVGNGAGEPELPVPSRGALVESADTIVPLLGVRNRGEEVGLDGGGRVITQGLLPFPETHALGRVPAPAVGEPDVPLVFATGRDAGTVAEHGPVIDPQVQSGVEVGLLVFSGVEMGGVIIEQGPIMLPAVQSTVAFGRANGVAKEQGPLIVPEVHRDVAARAVVGVKTHGPVIEPLLQSVVMIGADEMVEGTHGPTMEPNMQREPVVGRLPPGTNVDPPRGVVVLRTATGVEEAPGATGLEVAHGPAIVPPVQIGRLLVDMTTSRLDVKLLDTGQTLEGKAMQGSVTESPLHIDTVAGVAAVGAVPAVSVGPSTGVVLLSAESGTESLGANAGVAMHGRVIFPLVQ